MEAMYQVLGPNVLSMDFDPMEVIENFKKLSAHKRLVSNRSENIAAGYWTDPTIEVQVTVSDTLGRAVIVLKPGPSICYGRIKRFWLGAFWNIHPLDP